MMRTGLRVTERIAALRRAVVSEVEDLNRLIYHILRAGVLVSVAILLFGFVLAGVTGHAISDETVRPRELAVGLYHFTPDAYLSLGVLLMIFTPVVRVLLSLLAFAKERDRTYVLLTGIVFVNLMVSVFLLA
jgi:uncharacterized membrane protein